MRPSPDSIHLQIDKFLLRTVSFNISSLKWTGNTDLWVARLSEADMDPDGYPTRTYYRIAEGIGEKVINVSPRMLHSSSTRTLWLRPNPDIEPVVPITYDRLDWLFENRYA